MLHIGVVGVDEAWGTKMAAIRMGTNSCVGREGGDLVNKSFGLAQSLPEWRRGVLTGCYYSANISGGVKIVLYTSLVV